MPTSEAFPYPGIRSWRNRYGMTIVRLHYTADPNKDEQWAAKQKEGMTDPALYEQEYNINFEATQGSLVYQLYDEATICKRFPIPREWTRYYALDPHPSVPHSSLWCAVDPWGDRWYYREYWPSKIYGLKGAKVPSDDTKCPPRDYMEVVGYYESRDNDENIHQGVSFQEEIYGRVIDYTARAFGINRNDPKDKDKLNYQRLFEAAMDDLGMSNPRFDDAKKDMDVGVDIVNTGLKPIEVMGNDGTFRKSSRIHIFDDLRELICELRSVRRQQLTPLQAERMDPTGKPVEVRKHMVDCLRYLEMSNPEFIQRKAGGSSWSPINSGISY